MAKQEKLVKFYLSLQDAATLKRYHDDLEGLMTEAGLADDEKHLVRSGDEKELRHQLGDRLSASFRYVAPPRYGHQKKG